MARPRLDAAEWAVLIYESWESGLSLPGFSQRHDLSRGMMQSRVSKTAIQAPAGLAIGQFAPSRMIASIPRK